MATTWDKANEERDSDGNLTKLALALDAIEGTGCDCGTDEPGTCLACVCEAALRDQFDELARLRGEIASLKGEDARTVYVAAGGMHGAVDEMMNHNFHAFAVNAQKHALPGEDVWAVRTTARKVKP